MFEGVEDEEARENKENTFATSSSSQQVMVCNSPTNGITKCVKNTSESGVKQVSAGNFSKKGKIEEESFVLKSIDMNKIVPPQQGNYSFGVNNSTSYDYSNNNNINSNNNYFTKNAFAPSTTTTTTTTGFSSNAQGSCQGRSSGGAQNQSSNSSSCRKNSSKNSSGKQKSHHKYSNSNVLTLGDEPLTASQNFLGLSMNMNQVLMMGSKGNVKKGESRGCQLKNSRTVELAQEAELDKSSQGWHTTTAKKRTKSQNFHSDFKKNMQSIRKTAQKTPENAGQRVLTEALDFSSALENNNMASAKSGLATTKSNSGKNFVNQNSSQTFAGGSMGYNTASSSNLFSKKSKQQQQLQHDFVTKTLGDVEYIEKESQSGGGVGGAEDLERSWEFSEYPNRSEKSRKIKAYQRSIRAAFSSERNEGKSRENQETPSRSPEGAQWMHNYLTKLESEEDKHKQQLFQSFENPNYSSSMNGPKYEFLVGGFTKHHKKGNSQTFNMSSCSGGGGRAPNSRGMEDPPLINHVLSFEKDRRDFFNTTEGNNQSGIMYASNPNFSQNASFANSKSSTKKKHHQNAQSISYNSNSSFVYGTKAVRKNEIVLSGGLTESFAQSLRSPMKQSSLSSTIKMKTSPISSGKVLR